MRFGGINVGTIEDIDIINDTSIKVVMLINKDAQKFIKKNALASVGTDGLMGNKLININFVNEPSGSVEEGDVIRSLKPIETDEMLRTLNQTNQDVAVMVKNLKLITSRVSSPNSLWSILMDTVIAQNVKQAVVNIKLTSSRTAIVMGDLSEISQKIKTGNNNVVALLTDTSFATNLKQTIVNIKMVSDSLAYISGDFKSFSHKVKSGEGVIGTILMDTTFVHNLNQSMENIRSGTQGLDENMKAMKHTVFLRSYFRKKEKLEKQNELKSKKK